MPTLAFSLILCLLTTLLLLALDLALLRRRIHALDDAGHWVAVLVFLLAVAVSFLWGDGWAGMRAGVWHFCWAARWMCLGELLLVWQAPDA